MANVKEEFVSAVASASDGGKAGEAFNALRDFRPDIDGSRLASMSNEQLSSLWKAMTGGGKKTVRTGEQRRKALEDIRSRATASGALVRGLQEYAKGGAASKRPGFRASLNSDAGDLVTALSALKSAGLVSDGGGTDKLLSTFRDFSPAAFAAADEGAKAGQAGVAGGPPASEAPVSAGSAPPAGSTLIPGPSGLQGLTEAQIWREPGTGRIFKLPEGAGAGASAADYGLTPEQASAADALASDLASSDLVYRPKVSPDDISRYLTEGIASARAELDPYYKEVIGRARDAYVQSVQYETQARELQLRQEEIQRRQELEGAQADLEARGATFSGEAAKILGERAGVPHGLNSVVQGLLQEQQGIVASSSAQRYRQQVAALTQEAEQRLGSQEVSDVTGRNSLTDSLFTGLRTAASGDIRRSREADVQARGREIANAGVARELAQSPDFVSSGAALNFF